MNDGLVSGFLDFSAVSDTYWAHSEYDLGAQSWSFSGEDRTLVNERFAPTLNASAIWRDIHAFLFALVDIGDGPEHGQELSEMLGSAIPGDPTADKDVDEAERACYASAGICTVAIFWPPASGGCLVAAAACIKAADCIADDCAGDGHGV